MQRKPLNRYSERRIAELQAEAPIRIELCRRAGGTPTTREVQIYRNGQRYTYTKVECHNGICEICGRFGRVIEPHEDPLRSKGGKVSLVDSKMVHRHCYADQHSKPIWSSNARHNA